MVACHQALTKQNSINDDRHYSRLCKSFEFWSCLLLISFLLVVKGGFMSFYHQHFKAKDL